MTDKYTIKITCLYHAMLLFKFNCLSAGGLFQELNINAQDFTFSSALFLILTKQGHYFGPSCMRVSCVRVRDGLNM